MHEMLQCIKKLSGWLTIIFVTVTNVFSCVTEVTLHTYLITYLLRASSSSSLIVSRTLLSTVSDRAFLVTAARIWNSLPDLVTSAPSVAVFRSRLKTHLFNISYHSPL